MKKFLIRGAMTPFETFTAEEMLEKDRTGSNNGNLLYQYAVMRTLMINEEISFTPDGYLYDASKFRAEEINETYDAYIMPLADAFRNDFRPTLRGYTQLIRQLKIPVHIIGVGLRAPYEPNLANGFAFDNDVKDFIKAVLEKSPQIGLRGEITADYLKQLGFKEGIDYRVIGCPSLYTFGRTLMLRQPKLTKEACISLNASPSTSYQTLQFLEQTSEEYPNHYFIPQLHNELFLTYSGGPSIAAETKTYPHTIHHHFYRSGKAKYFLNARTWFDYMKKVEISVGSRLHGNVAATIAGTPSISIVQDARMRELTNWHGLAHVPLDQISQYSNLEDLLGVIDPSTVEKKQGKNFDNFIDFLTHIGLPHIYEQAHHLPEVPFDKKIQVVSEEPPVEPLTTLSQEEMLERIQVGSTIYKSRTDRQLQFNIYTRESALKKLRHNSSILNEKYKNTKNDLSISQESIQSKDTQISQLEKIIANQTNQLVENSQAIDYLQRTLNRKSVKTILTIADKIAALKK